MQWPQVFHKVPKVVQVPIQLMQKKNTRALGTKVKKWEQKSLCLRKEINKKKLTLEGSVEINIPFGLQDYKTVYRLMLCWISILCECVSVVSTTTKGETQNLLKSLGAAQGFMSQSKLGCAAVFGY